MANSERPWFPFYARDWQTDLHVRVMSLECRGAYLELLCTQWENGGIPESPSDLAILLGFESIDSGVHFQATIWNKLEPHFPPAGDGSRQNPRLERIRKVDAQKKLHLSNAGKIGRRKQLDSQELVGVARARPGQTSESESDEEKTSCGFVYPEAFEEFWKAYPPGRSGRKPGKRAALDAWKKTPKAERPLATEAAMAYAASEGPRGFIKHAHRFLSKDFWRDWLGASEATPGALEGEREILVLALRGRHFGDTVASKDGLEGGRGVELWEQISIERLRRMSDDLEK